MKADKPPSAPRFLVPGPLAAGQAVELPERVARHIGVLRLRAGDPLTLFTGENGEFGAELTLAARGSARARVGAFRAVERESPLSITLAQCISSGDRMDLTLQKATELGVADFVPLASERCVVRLRDERAGRKRLHWQNVVASACEQCGRNRLPAVAEPADIHAWLAALGRDTAAGPAAGTRLLLAPGADAGMAQLPRAERVILLVGPEGGLVPAEIDAALHAGFRAVRLGPRTLRTETAPLAALAALQLLWGDLN